MYGITFLTSFFSFCFSYTSHHRTTRVTNGSGEEFVGGTVVAAVVVMERRMPVPLWPPGGAVLPAMTSTLSARG